MITQAEYIIFILVISVLLYTRPNVLVNFSKTILGRALLLITLIIATLRSNGIHTRRSYKTTRNVGKLLTEAAKVKATFTVILGQELERDCIVVKNMESGEQVELQRDQLLVHITP